MMTNAEAVAAIFPEIKDPEAAALKIQIGLGPDRTFELGWERALLACRLHHEEKVAKENEKQKNPDKHRTINWRLSGMNATYQWSMFAVKFEKTAPIPQEMKPSITIDRDLGAGWNDE